MPRRTFAWENLPTQQLLELRLKDLKVTVEGTWLEDCLRELHDELEQRGIRIRPHAWISNEWFSPDNTPGIAIPFYLAHPRLMRLERKMIIDVEGGTRAGVHAHPAPRGRPRRCSTPTSCSAAGAGRSCSAAPRTRYPRYYRPNPASRNFVQHLRLWYAQSHPDEDFAETFAVWLTPRSNWRKRYEGWPALKKLRICRRADGRDRRARRPLLTRRMRVDPLSQLDETLGRALRRRSRRTTRSTRRRPTTATCAASSPTIRGTAARRRPRPSSGTTAREIRRMVSKWTGEYQLTLDAVLDDMIDRCRELKLRAVGSERQLRMDFTVLLTAKTVHSLYSPSRRQWFAL